MRLQDTSLVLFLTAGTSLADWHNRGLLAREAELYVRLRPHLRSIAWVTYGGLADLEYQNLLPGITILPNRWRLPNQVYVQQLPWLHQDAFHNATILKSEQTGAAEGALAIAKYFGKRYIARSGFSLALFATYAPQEYEEGYDAILDLERRSFQAAQQVVVTTEEMRESALKLHSISPQKIRIIPNYVNTERFHPMLQQPEKPLLVFAGRFAEQKNILNLLEAVAPLRHIKVEFIGGGELRPELEARITAGGLSHVKLVGSVSNEDLPAYLQRATLYVQPSRYEGHPKTIFEAMACGLPVLVGDSPGIRQFVRHGETGWLCGLETAYIRAGIEKLLEDAELRARLGQNARQYVEKNFALDAVVQQELEMLQQVLTQSAPLAQPGKRPVLRSMGTYAARVIRLARKAGMRFSRRSDAL
jgi:glycosyltransferase involved in cell wall biosynthesis